MNELEKQKKYLNYKYLLSIIFIIDILEETEEFDPSDFYEIDLLKNIRIVLDVFSKEESINNIVKENMFKFLNAGRYIEDENKEERNEIINDIITILNNSKEDKNLIFYREELVKRTGDIRYLFKYSNDVIRNNIDRINKSIGFDLTVLEALSEETKEEEFINLYLPDLVDNAFYLSSINAIMKECPSLFKNSTFYNRNICVLNNLNSAIVENNKKFIKTIKKGQKKVIK